MNWCTQEAFDGHGPSGSLLVSPLILRPERTYCVLCGHLLSFELDSRNF